MVIDWTARPAPRALFRFAAPAGNTTFAPFVKAPSFQLPELLQKELALPFQVRVCADRGSANRHPTARVVNEVKERRAVGEMGLLFFMGFSMVAEFWILDGWRAVAENEQGFDFLDFRRVDGEIDRPQDVRSSTSRGIKVINRIAGVYRFKRNRREQLILITPSRMTPGSGVESTALSR